MPVELHIKYWQISPVSVGRGRGKGRERGGGMRGRENNCVEGKKCSVCKPLLGHFPTTATIKLCLSWLEILLVQLWGLLLCCNPAKVLSLLYLVLTMSSSPSARTNTCNTCPFYDCSFIQLGNHLPHCKQRLSLLVKSRAGPAHSCRKVCPKCRRSFQWLDMHLRLSAKLPRYHLFYCRTTHTYPRELSPATSHRIYCNCNCSRPRFQTSS